MRELDRIAATTCEQTLNTTETEDRRQAAYGLLNNDRSVHQMAQRIVRDHPEFHQQVDVDTVVRIAEVAIEQQLVLLAFGPRAA